METLATRYARALFDIALEENKVKDYLKETKKLDDSIESNPQFVHLLSSYFIEQGEKDEVVDQVYSNIELVNVKNFVKVVTKNGKAYMLPRFLREFIKMAETQLGIVSGTCYSVTKLTEKELSEIEQAFTKRLQHEVKLTNVIDEQLIGGVKVIIAGKVFDGSLKAKIDNLKINLTKGGNK